MSCPVYLFVFLQLPLYLFVRLPLSLLLISLVFSLTIPKTAHLPNIYKKKNRQKKSSYGLKEGCKVRGWLDAFKNNKFLIWTTRGTPGSKLVASMFPQQKQMSGSRLRRGVLLWMWVFTGKPSAERDQKWSKRSRPLKHLIPVFFTVNPQWSHQHWYESGCGISSFLAAHEWISAPQIPSRRMDLKHRPLLFFVIFFIVMIQLFLYFPSKCPLRSPSSADSSHCHSIHFKQTSVFFSLSFLIILV